MVQYEILLLNLYGESKGNYPVGQAPVSAIMTEVKTLYYPTDAQIYNS